MAVFISCRRAFFLLLLKVVASSFSIFVFNSTDPLICDLPLTKHACPAVLCVFMNARSSVFSGAPEVCFLKLSGQGIRIYDLCHVYTA